MDCKYAPPPLVLLAHHADGRDAPAALLIHCVCAVAGPLDPNSAWCPSTLDRHFTLVHRKAEEGEEEETEEDEDEASGGRATAFWSISLGNVPRVTSREYDSE